MTQHRDVGNATDTACRSSFDVTLGLRTAHDRKLGWGVCRERERGRGGKGRGGEGCVRSNQAPSYRTDGRDEEGMRRKGWVLAV